MLALIVPDDNNIDILLERLECEKLESPCNTSLYKANIKNHDFLIMITGYGKVNITRSLQFLSNNYPLKVIIQTGTAGSISDCNDILSAIVVNSALEYDVDFMPLGYAPGVIPGLKNGVYSCNNDLIDCMQRACNSSNVNYSTDLIATGDMFVCNNGLANSIRVEYGASAVDCECGVVGQYAYINDIPFACLKVVSDFAYNNAVKQYNLYDVEARRISQKIIYNFLKDYYS